MEIFPCPDLFLTMLRHKLAESPTISSVHDLDYVIQSLDYIIQGVNYIVQALNQRTVPWLDKFESGQHLLLVEPSPVLHGQCYQMMSPSATGFEAHSE